MFVFILTWNFNLIIITDFTGMIAPQERKISKGCSTPSLTLHKSNLYVFTEVKVVSAVRNRSITEWVGWGGVGWGGVGVGWGGVYIP